MWSCRKRLPKVDEYSENIVDRTAMDDCLAAGIQVREELGEDLASDAILEGFDYELGVGAFVGAPKEVEVVA